MSSFIQISQDSLLASFLAVGVLLVGVRALWDSRKEPGRNSIWARRIGRAMLAASILLVPLAAASLYVDSIGRWQLLNWLVKSGRVQSACALAHRRDSWAMLGAVCRANGTVDFTEIFRAASNEAERARTMEVQADVDLGVALQLARTVEKEEQQRMIQILLAKWNSARVENIPQDLSVIRQLITANNEHPARRDLQVGLLASRFASQGKRELAIALSADEGVRAQSGVFRILATRAATPEEGRRDWARAIELEAQFLATPEPTNHTASLFVEGEMAALGLMLRDLPADESFAPERTKLHNLVRTLGARNRDPLADPKWIYVVRLEVMLWRDRKEPAEANALLRACWSALTSKPASPRRARVVEEWLTTLKEDDARKRFGIDGAATPPGPVP